ncbi:MAG: tetratricopeptide repeat protein [Bacteroidota bacterium]
MGKEEKMKEENKNSYEALKALYYSGKVRPSLNKVTAELENDPENLPLTLLACKILERTKEFERLSSYADAVIKLSPEISDGYYYKGVALQFVKGKEQEALKNLNKALKIDPENVLYLKTKASTHLSLFKDFDLPLKFAEQHRVKSETSLLKVIELIEKKENPSYKEFYILAEVNMMIELALNAKMYYLKAVNAYEATDESEQDKNIYKDIIKAQKKCIKQLEKFTE